MKLSGSLWYTTTRPDFIVGDARLWSRSSWFFSNSYSGIMFSTVSLNNSSYYSSSIIFFVCIGNVSGFISIVHSIDAVIWVNKAYWINFRCMLYMWHWGDLLFTCQYFCWSIWVLILVCDCSEVAVILLILIDRKWDYESACFKRFIMLHKQFSHLPFFQVHTQYKFLLGMEVRSSFIFGRVCIDNVEMCVYVHVSDGWGNYDDERYWKSFLWK